MILIRQKNNFFWFKFNGLTRYLLAHLASGLFPLYIVNEYPKGGGSWIGEMLSEALDIPFPRNRLPVLKPSILHGHMMHSWNLHNILLVWRDGRDVLISEYYHSLFENEQLNTRLVQKTRSYLGFSDYHDIRANLPAFMDYVYQKRSHPRMTWKKFADKWSGCEKCVHVKYEAMHADAAGELSRIIEALGNNVPSEKHIHQIVDRHSFQRVSGRKPGEQQTKSFLRKGIVGDWKNHFSAETRKQFDQYAGDTLIKLGYETSRAWVERPNLD